MKLKARDASSGTRTAILFSAFLLLFVGASYQQAVAPRDWSFPRDHGRHDGFRIEWWYFTGNLTDYSGRRFGYQLTFFRSLLSPASPQRESPWAASDLYFAHAAVADVQDKQFYYRDTLSRGRAGLASASDQTMDVSLKDWSAKLDHDVVHLSAATLDFAINLDCGVQKPILQGPGGLSQKGPAVGQASYYYSMPRMNTTGAITIKGKRYALSGLTWFDHEFSSNLLSDNQSGWDWISLQLLDGRSLMVYRLRNKDGTDTRFGSLAAADGSVTYLSQNEIDLTPANPHRAPSGAEYPQRWKVKIAGIDQGKSFEVQTLLPNCELQTDESTKVTYYEGPMDAVGADGTRLGSGYLEMTGYGPR